MTNLYAQSLQDSLSVALFKCAQHEAPIFNEKKSLIDSLKIDPTGKNVQIYARDVLGYIAYREEIVSTIKDSLRIHLPKEYSKYKIEIFTNGYELEDLVPNYYRTSKIDKKRIDKNWIYEHPLVSNLSKRYQPSKGLLNNVIALWASHGCYYNNKQGWIWQRPILYQIVEDTYTLGYVLPYLTPMLENAGAYVMMPRERDTQLNEVIVDNDERGSFLYEECNDEKARWHRGDSTGFAKNKDLYVDGENPFKNGTYREIRSNKDGIGYANWTPEIPEDGEYAVYISYHSLPNSATDAHYMVYHTGGSSQFIVNQKMGGSTWIYLGTFHFKKGLNPDIGRVELSNKGKSNGIITADAVRFGGGYGLIGKYNENDSICYSNKPKYLEGARYWLQWAGYSDSIYSRNQGENDYADDYMCRGHWVNDLIGGSTKSPQTKGKNIPVELAMGFHTDAGCFMNDSIVGTLAIYMSESNKKRTYLNGQRRIVSRDLSDIIQTQIVSDIRNTFRPNWTRRKLYDRSYYEARVPEVPTFLLELLSHQNFADMRYGLDPHFKFTVSRAIYKGILKFLCYQQNREYIVQPLPVKNFSAEFFNEENNVVHLSWIPQGDTLEETATAHHYILYTATDDNGWNNGQIVNTPSVQITLEPHKLYRFKVTAVNNGGESFPSEVLAAGYVPNSTKAALVINGFHRVSAPESFETPGYSGFLSQDQGVPDHYDISYTGEQYAFNKRNKFKSDTNPGHGASGSLYENVKIAGNTFDFPAVHGKSIMKAGYSFVSCSDEVIREGGFRLDVYQFIDYILGEEKSTVVGQDTLYQLFPKEIRNALIQYLFKYRGNLYVSGAYVASDLYERDTCDEVAIKFAEHILKYKLAESRQQGNGILSNYFSPWADFQQSQLHYCHTLNDVQYAVESPDAIDSANGSRIIHSFADNNLPTTVGFRGRYKTIVSSIPFESIISEEDRDTLMHDIIHFFER